MLSHKGFRARIVIEQVMERDNGSARPDRSEDVVTHKETTLPLRPGEFAAALADPVAVVRAAPEGVPEQVPGPSAERPLAPERRGSDRFPALIAELDELDWSFIYGAVSGPVPEGAQSMFRDDVLAARDRVFNKVHRIIGAISPGSPLELRLRLLPLDAAAGEDYGPEVGSCMAQREVFPGIHQACGLPMPERERGSARRMHDGPHSFTTTLSLWRCRRGHVIEQVMGVPSKCKIEGCTAIHFVPLTASARRSWMDSRDSMAGERTTEIPVVRDLRGGKD